jgi:hypothetical protein
MTHIEKEDVIVPVGPPNTHAEAAQLLIQELHEWGEQIPRREIPETADATRRLAPAASISSTFIELTNVAVANQTALMRADGAPPAQVRDLVAYADAYSPLADELEARAQILRYNTTAARNLAATEALTTYALAQRLSKQKRYAHLKPHVADMRRALGRQRKPTPEEAAQNAADRAAKAAAKVAAKVAKAAPAPGTVTQ